MKFLNTYLTISFLIISNIALSQGREPAGFFDKEFKDRGKTEKSEEKKKDVEVMSPTFIGTEANPKHAEQTKDVMADDDEHFRPDPPEKDIKELHETREPLDREPKSKTDREDINTENQLLQKKVEILNEEIKLLRAKIEDLNQANRLLRIENQVRYEHRHNAERRNDKERRKPGQE